MKHKNVSNKNSLLKAIDNIDYTHLLGYPSEFVAAEVINMVKDIIYNSDVAFAKAVQDAETRMRESAPEGNIVSFEELKCYYKGKTNEEEE